VAGWSLMLAAIAVLALLVMPFFAHSLQMYGLVLVALMTLIERYLSLRLKLDQHLFTSLARGEIASLHDLDQALAALGLRTPSTTPRPLSERIAGTRRLLLRHALAVGLQTLAMAAVIVSAALK
jgi:hypothetical protein